MGLNAIPGPDGFNHDAVFEAGDLPETTATTSRANNSTFGHVDDDVLIHF
jgi:hypothetical protein